MISVPKLDDKDVEKLLEILNLNSGVKEIPYLPEDYCKVNECFPNVEQKIIRDGGIILYGWRFWKHPFMVEAEFHAVWQSKSGSLKDITPDQVASDYILFIEDRNMRYEGRQVDNVRLKTKDNLLIDDYIELFNARYRLLNKNHRIDQSSFSLEGSDAEVYRFIEVLIPNIEQMILNNQSRNSPCFCNSEEKYKRCHGKDLKYKLNQII